MSDDGIETIPMAISQAMAEFFSQTVFPLFRDSMLNAVAEKHDNESGDSTE